MCLVRLSRPLSGHDDLEPQSNRSRPSGISTTNWLYRRPSIVFEPVHEKTNNLGFRLGPTQTRLYSHRKELEA